jgi:hypothetical protein
MTSEAAERTFSIYRCANYCRRVRVTHLAACCFAKQSAITRGLDFGRISMRRNTFILAIFALTFGSSSALGQAEMLSMQRTALKDITDAAERICNSIPLSGVSQSAELSGQAKAEVNGVIKKVAELGVAGAGKYQTSEFSNVLQRDLAQAIQTNANCKQTVFNVLVDRMIPARPSAPSGPPATQLNTAKSPSQPSLKQGLHDRAAIFIEIQVPKPRTPDDEEFLRDVGDNFNFIMGKYDPKFGNGEMYIVSYGASFGQVTASDTTLNFAAWRNWGCSGSFRRGDPGILLGRISCRDATGKTYPRYDATINLGW